MSLIGIHVAFLGEGFPRVSGDEPGYCYDVHHSLTFSPRERG